MTKRSMARQDAGTTRDVKAMYEAFPYPSPTAGDTLIEDVANSFYSIFGDDTLEGKRILDAGCGTGHRLLAVARRYPAASFVGADMTAASIEVAKTLMRKHEIGNVTFHTGDLLEYRPDRKFDVIVSAGVVHHLENPGQGLAALSSLLEPEGMLVVWLYHALGEHQRLLDRETLLTMWERESGFEQGLQILRQLGVHLQVEQYGSSAAQAAPEISQLSIDVDAYLHPIVNAYRFDETIDMLRDAAGLAWAAVNNINLPGTSRLVDLDEVEAGDMSYFCQSVDGLFESDALRQRFRALALRKRLKVLELRLQPTGFTIVAGRGESYRRLTPRLRSNVIPL